MNVSEASEQEVLAIVERSLASGDRAGSLSETCRVLRSRFAQYNWVGVYLLEGSQLRLAAWDGKEATEHTLIPVDKGICGMAAREDRTVIVGDVDQDPSYLACFPYTRSEIVVPIRKGGSVVGEIDIDGDRRNAYDASDDRFLTRVAERLATIL